MFKVTGERAQKGIADAQVRHMLDGIVFRNGVVELNRVGVFLIVRKKGLKKRKLGPLRAFHDMDFSAKILAFYAAGFAGCLFAHGQPLPRDRFAYAMPCGPYCPILLPVIQHILSGISASLLLVQFCAEVEDEGRLFPSVTEYNSHLVGVP